MKRLLIPLAAAAASLALAGTSAAGVTAAGVRAAGTVKAFGTTGPTAHFVLYNSGVVGHKLVYSEPGIRFRALTMSNVVFGLNAAKFMGIALVNGHAAHYTAIVVEHPRTAGVFKLDWTGPGSQAVASRGGVLVKGNVVVTPQAYSP